MKFTITHSDERVISVPDDDVRALLDAWAKITADWPDDDGTFIGLSDWEVLPDLPQRGDSFIYRSGRDGRFIVREVSDDKVVLQIIDHSAEPITLDVERFYVRFIKAP